MKTFTLIATAALFCLGSFTLSAQQVNEKIQVNSNGSWYHATILKVNPNDGTYFITYDGWSDSWDEWVPLDRMKGYGAQAAPESKSSLTKFKVGDKVEAEYGFIMEPATVIEVGENKYHVQYDNTLFKTKWLSESLLRKL